jgi:hypothetical protein
VHGVWPQGGQRRKVRLRNEHPAEPAVILKGDKSSVVGGDLDVIMRASDISLDVVREQTSGHAQVYHQTLRTKM